MTRYSYKHFEMSFFLEKNGKKIFFGEKLHYSDHQKIQQVWDRVNEKCLSLYI
jgi:hypothetical protein